MGDHDGGDDVANNGADLRVYEDLMMSADGTRAGWLGVIAGLFRGLGRICRFDCGRSAGAAVRGRDGHAGHCEIAVGCSGGVAGRGHISVHPRQRDLPRRVSLADDVLPWHTGKQGSGADCAWGLALGRFV